MEREIVVAHPEGLHARPAAEVVKAAARFQSRVEIVSGGQSANARSILAILKLGIKVGQPVTLRADGVDAEQAVTELARLLEQTA